MEVDPSSKDDPKQVPVPSRRRRRDPDAESELEHTPSKSKRMEDPDQKKPALPKEPAIEGSDDESRSRSVSPESQASDIYNRLFVPKYSAELSSYRLLKVDFPGDSRFLCELKIGPPSRVELDHVPNDRRHQLRGYNSMGRKMTDQMTHYRNVTELTLKKLDQFWSDHKKLSASVPEKVASVMQHVEELEDVVMSLEFNVSKAVRHFNLCFCYATDINKIYLNLYSVPREYHEEQLEPVGYNIDLFRKRMRKAHYAIRVAGIRSSEIQYLQSAIASELEF